jgi:hypothetical protein
MAVGVGTAAVAGATATSTVKKRRKAKQTKAAANHARKIRVEKQAQDLINKHRRMAGRPTKSVGAAAAKRRTSRSRKK